MPPAHLPAEFRTTAAEDGLTLATALRKWLPGESWSQIKNRIAQRRVSIGGTLCLDQGRQLVTGEIVTLLDRPLPPPPTIAHVVLRHVDEELVVVEKPPGMITLRHPAERRWPAQRKQQQPTLDEAVAALLAAREHLERLPRLRCVHRIDRETSGLLVLARTPQAEQALIEQFAAHTVHRRYLSVVQGLPATGVIRSQLVRDRGDGLRGSTPKADVGQTAITHVQVKETWNHLTLIECRLETGRTHQIRIHLTEAGHPVCGDTVYRAPFGQPALPDNSGAPRLALHAAELGFLHPQTGKQIKFESPLPADLVNWIDVMRK